VPELLSYLCGIHSVAVCLITPESRAAVSHTNFYQSRQHVLHASVVLTIFKHLNTWFY